MHSYNVCKINDTSTIVYCKLSKYYLHTGRPTIIHSTVTMNPIRIRNVYCLLIRRKTDPIRSPELVGSGPRTPGFRIISVDLIRQPRRRPITLFISVDRIGKPSRPITVDNDIVYGIEWSSVEITQRKFRFIRRAISGHLV